MELEKFLDHLGKGLFIRAAWAADKERDAAQNRAFGFELLLMVAVSVEMPPHQTSKEIGWFRYSTHPTSDICLPESDEFGVVFKYSSPEGSTDGTLVNQALDLLKNGRSPVFNYPYEGMFWALDGQYEGGIRRCFNSEWDVVKAHSEDLRRMLERIMMWLKGKQKKLVNEGFRGSIEEQILHSFKVRLSEFMEAQDKEWEAYWEMSRSLHERR